MALAEERIQDKLDADREDERILKEEEDKLRRQ